MRFALSKKTKEIRLLSKLKSVRLLKLTVAKQRTMRLSSPLRFDSSRQPPDGSFLLENKKRIKKASVFAFTLRQTS